MSYITRLEFGRFSKHIQKLTGICLGEEKLYFLENRLGELRIKEGCGSFDELYNKILKNDDKTLETEFVDAITTKETSFFRDTTPFELLKYKIIPELIDRRTPTLTELQKLPIPINIWCAACSTGQEVYSIAIALKELLGDLGKYTIRLLATDISDLAIAKASAGVFSNQEVRRGLSDDQLRRYFTVCKGGWKIGDELRAMVTFQKVNLARSLEHMGRFDVIFCRNVAIYFSPAQRRELFDTLDAKLEPDGCLILGSSETLTNISTKYESLTHMGCRYYMLKERKRYQTF